MCFLYYSKEKVKRGSVVLSCPVLREVLWIQPTWVLPGGVLGPVHGAGHRQGEVRPRVEAVAAVEAPPGLPLHAVRPAAEEVPGALPVVAALALAHQAGAADAAAPGGARTDVL